MNLASEKGIAKGVGGDRFDPFGVCGAREFITMLYRLTHISEGSDYSWATALEDFVSGVKELRDFRSSGWSLPVAPENFASGLKNWFDQDSPFTREVTADVMYLMLSFNAGPEKESLTDQLTAGKKTELEKADALCEWIATHIYYDYVDLKAHIDDIKDQSAAAVLERRTAIYDGYSALTLAMLRAAGLDAMRRRAGATA